MSPGISGSLIPPYITASRDFDNNAPQRRAYDSDGHCVVLAGPGSGKTKVLTAKIARLLAEDIREPRGIACVTYSSECARELVRRLGCLGVRTSRNLFIGTVHSFCLKSVVIPYARLSGVQLADPVRVASVEEQDIAFQRSLANTVSTDENPDTWRPRCDSLRRTALERTDDVWGNDGPDEAKVVIEYERLLHNAGLIDFDDMVFLGLKLIERHRWLRKVLQARFPVLVVDEYQDLGLALHRIVLALCFQEERACRLFAVGDADQSIYGFTGAKPELLRELTGRHSVQNVTLRLNYRSKQSIVAASEVVLGEKRGYEAASGAGGLIEFHECPEGLCQQANKVCQNLVPDVLRRKVARNLGEIAVLYQDRYMGDEIAECVTACGLSFVRIDRNSYYRKTPLTRWLEECAMWCTGGWRSGTPPLSSLINPWLAFNNIESGDTVALSPTKDLLRFLCLHRNHSVLLKDWLKSFGEACLLGLFRCDLTLGDEAHAFSQLSAAADDNGPLGEWSVEQFAGQGGSPDHLRLLTLHSCKGLEFDVVFMLGLDQGRIPKFFQKTPESKRESRRLFYVGLTRARNEAHLLYSGWTENKYGRRFRDGPSEFLLEVRRSIGDKQKSD